MSLGDDLDVPFEPQALTPTDLSDGHVASGVVILAGVLPVDGMTPRPCLVYRFANPDGSGFYPPMVLVADDDQIAKAGPLTAKAIDAALAAALAAR